LLRVRCSRLVSGDALANEEGSDDATVVTDEEDVDADVDAATDEGDDDDDDEDDDDDDEVEENACSGMGETDDDVDVEESDKGGTDATDDDEETDVVGMDDGAENEGSEGS